MHSLSRSTRAFLSAAALVVLAVTFTASASAKVVKDSATGAKFGVFPSIRGSGPAAKPISTTCSTSCSALVFHSGGRVQHGEREYLFFWAPSGHSIPSVYQSGLSTWLKEIVGKDYTGGNPISVNQQYYDFTGPSGAKRFATYGVTRGSTIVDTNPYPANGCTDTDANATAIPICLTKDQIQTELLNYISAHALPTGLTNQYYVFTPVGVGSCFDGTSSTCSYTGYCGWHADFVSGSTTLLYADMPWAYNVSGCDTNLAFGTGYPNGDAIDPVVGVFSHEMSESMTDPLLNAWFDGSGNEIGDKCAYDYGAGGFGSTSGLANNGLGFWNVALFGDQYLMQLEFDNHTADCVVKSTFTQPTISVGPTTATAGASQSYTASITASAGVAYVVWNFGDGTPVVTTTGTSLSHTYTTAGTYSAIVRVTDNNGSERQVTQTITVS